jgi:hypothetical protein
MSTITSLFQQAQLAEAAYADFLDDAGFLITTDAQYKSSLRANGFSQAQANEFTTHWKLVDQYTATDWGGWTDGSGFSATLFESLDNPGQYSLAIRGSTPSDVLKDFRDDFDIIATDGIAVQQLVDLYNYWKSLTTSTNSYQAATLNTQIVASAFLSVLYAGTAAQVPDALSTLFGGATTIDSYDIARAVMIAGGYIVEGGTVYQLEWGDSQYVLPGSHIAIGLNKVVPCGATVNVNGHGLQAANEARYEIERRAA